MVNVEGVIVSALRGVGIDARVSVPADRPDAFCVVGRTGGGSDSLVIDRPSVTVEAWAPTKARAFALAASARSAMAGLPGTGGVYAVECTSQSYEPDPSSGTPRYRIRYHLVTSDKTRV